MAEYIDRGKLQKYFQDRFDWLSNNAEKKNRLGTYYDEKLRTAAIIIKECLDKTKNTPTEDVAPIMHGVWVYDEKEACFECNACGYSALNNYRGLSADSDYCPHCGAKMDLKAEKE